MDAHAHETVDVEAAKPKAAPGRNVALMEAGALLALWSVLVINEGAIRLIAQNPAVDLLAAGRPSRIFPFLGGVFEVFFGLLGVFLGLAAFILNKHNTLVTKVSMVIQTILGYYVFVIFVFVLPAFTATDLVTTQPPELSIGENRFVIALGVLTSFHFCLALQGGQFVFMARLVTAATGRDFLKQKTGAKMRAIFWNANLAFSGLWTLITGAVINSSVGSGRLPHPGFASPPNVGVLPGMTIFTGLLLLVWGLVGVAMAVMNMSVPGAYYIGTALVYTFGLLNFGIVQFGLLEGPPAGPVALHNGLVFMVTFIGPYFLHLADAERKGETA